MELVIQSALDYIRDVFQNDFSGHDYYHSLRVYRMAVALAKEENADVDIAALAALLHDVDDRKLSPETTKEKTNAVNFMRGQNVPEAVISQVLTILDEVSFKGTDSVTPSTLEGKCVQDADRLDALGAIGIARTFAYGGSHQRALYDPEVPPNPNMDEKEYQKSNSSTLNHFYEKLFLLESMMNTQAGRRIARKRTRYMEQFVAEFLREWDGRLEE